MQCESQHSTQSAHPCTPILLPPPHLSPPQDIIGIIGLGQTFNAQGVREEDNTVASDRAFMLRRAALGTATGKRVLNWV